MTFSELYYLYRCDVEKITAALNNVEPWMVDRLINRAMRIAYEAKKEAERVEVAQASSRDLHIRRRDTNREIRRAHA